MATKKVTKKAAKKAVKKDNIYWVVQERSKLFKWKAHSLYATYSDAATAREALEQDNILSMHGYKVDRVELINNV